MSQRPPRPTDLVAGRRDWRAELERDYQQTARRLADAYARVTPALRERVNALISEYEALAEVSYPTPGAVRGLTSYGDLLARIELEMRDFAVLARDEAGRLQGQAIQLALPGVFESVAAQLPDPEIVSGVWMRPDPAALERLIGYVDSEAMRAKFATFGENAAQNFADGLLAMTAQGRNPVEIARWMRGWYNLPYSWAENMTRTTQLYSYRSATHASYKANERLLDGWMWRAALDVRTCLSCVSQHGSIHSVNETLNDHHQGRCAPVPVVKGTTWAQGVEAGRDWYGRLPESVQRRMAGNLMWTALRDGAVQWDELSRPYKDDVFGEMLREASVVELVDERRYLQLFATAAMLPRNRITNERAAVVAANVRVNRGS